MISPLALVETDRLGPDVVIHPFAVVRPGVTLGKGVVIHPHVVIESGADIGDGAEIFPGSYIGKEPKGAGATARTPASGGEVVIGPGCAVGPHAVIFRDVRIGRNTLIGDGASIREKVRIGSFCIVSRYVTINYNTTIGDRTKIMDLTHITGNTTIGDDVFVSILVATTNDNAIGKLQYDEERIRGPVIRNGAAVGAGGNLLPGVVVGEGAVVGAGALVSRDVPDRTLVVGIPARVVKDLGEKPAGEEPAPAGGT